MAQRILRLADNGDYVGEEPVHASVGALDAGRVPVLGEDGYLHPSIMRGHHVHPQPVPSDTWVVTHNLGKIPALTVLDDSGDTVFADVRYDSLNQLTILFSAPWTGTAYCN
jgi:hypothetical protein